MACLRLAGVGEGTLGWEPRGYHCSHFILHVLCTLEQVLCPLLASVSPSVKGEVCFGSSLRALPALKVSELPEWMAPRCPVSLLSALSPPHLAWPAEECRGGSHLLLIHGDRKTEVISIKTSSSSVSLIFGINPGGQHLS